MGVGGWRREEEGGVQWITTCGLGLGVSLGVLKR
jgi:hypothetical protein